MQAERTLACAMVRLHQLVDICFFHHVLSEISVSFLHPTLALAVV